MPATTPASTRRARTIRLVFISLGAFLLIALGLGAWGVHKVRTELKLRELAAEYTALSAFDRTDPGRPRMHVDIASEKARLLRDMAAFSPPESARWARARARAFEWMDPTCREFATAHNVVFARQNHENPWAVSSVDEVTERIAALTRHRDASLAMRDTTAQTKSKLQEFMHAEGCDMNRWQSQLDAFSSSNDELARGFDDLAQSAEGHMPYFTFVQQHADHITAFERGHPKFDDPDLNDQQEALIEKFADDGE